VTVSGTLTPARSGIAILLTYTKPNGTTFIGAAITTADGSYSDAYVPDQVGSWKVKASWLGDNDHEGSTSSVVAFSVEEVRGVSVSISPSENSGKPGETIYFIVNIINTGEVVNSYSLAAGDDAGWGPTVSPSTLSLAEGESDTAVLSVSIPSNAIENESTMITITVISQTNSNVRSSTTCMAIAEAKETSGPPGPPWVTVIAILITAMVAATGLYLWRK
jgi:uncharacterized membrane protein